MYWLLILILDLLNFDLSYIFHVSCPLNEILLKMESIRFLLLLENIIPCVSSIILDYVIIKEACLIKWLTLVLFPSVYSSEEEVEEV